MRFFDITSIASKMISALRRKEKEIKTEEVEIEVDENLPPEVLEELKKDYELLKLYENLSDRNKKFVFDAIVKGKINDKQGLRKTIRKIVKSGDTDDMYLAINYYSIKRYGVEFMKLSEPKQQSVLIDVMKGLPQNKLMELYTKFQKEV